VKPSLPNNSPVLARKLRRLAERLGSQVKLGEATGINHNSIVRYVSGETEPRASALGRIAMATGVSVDWLLAPEPPSAFRTIVRIKREVRS
jgi:transcriptional regulator with XRE-family HTH domain